MSFYPVQYVTYIVADSASNSVLAQRGTQEVLPRLAPRPGLTTATPQTAASPAASLPAPPLLPAKLTPAPSAVASSSTNLLASPSARVPTLVSIAPATEKPASPIPVGLYDTLDVSKARENFNKELSNIYGSGNRTTKPEWNRQRIKEIIKILKLYKAAPMMSMPRTNAQYHYASKYEIAKINGEECLIQKREKPDDQVIKIVPSEEYFDILNEIHIKTGHGGRDKVLYSLKSKFIIPTSAVTAFIKNCEICKNKKSYVKKDIAWVRHHPDVFHCRGKVELINMQKMPDKDYNHILYYQDSFTKFIILRPLKTNTIEEISTELLKIFLEFGCPPVLDTEFERKVTSDIIRRIESKLPSCKILNGKGKKKCKSAFIKESTFIHGEVEAWMQNEKSTNWSLGIHFVQFKKNNQVNKSLNKTPFISLFGKPAQQGLKYFVRDSILRKVRTEEDLEIIYKLREPEPEIINTEIKKNHLPDKVKDFDTINFRYKSRDQKQKNNEIEVKEEIVEELDIYEIEVKEGPVKDTEKVSIVIEENVESEMETYEIEVKEEVLEKTEEMSVIIEDNDKLETEINEIEIKEERVEDTEEISVIIEENNKLETKINEIEVKKEPVEETEEMSNVKLKTEINEIVVNEEPVEETDSDQDALKLMSVVLEENIDLQRLDTQNVINIVPIIKEEIKEYEEDETETETTAKRIKLEE